MDELDIFSAALELITQDERDRYLNEACEGRPDLRKRIETLLESSAKASRFMEASPSGLEVSPTLDQPVPERPGTQIGVYKLREQIGEGGMGTVFVADQQQPLRRKVALKVIKAGMDSKAVIARFEAERNALALMNHPNIAKVLDAGTTQSGRPYFVMELIRGVSIVDYCDDQELTTVERLDLFVTVCRAVQHAHAKGVIHRDLKPGNILISPHDGIPVVKIIDFGIAKAVGQHLTDKTIYTQLSQMIGTPLYMSPEQAELNALDVDTRSDIYSLGVLLYELLTGTTPFDRERFSRAAHEEIRRIIREEEPPTPSRRLSSLGDTLEAISVHRKTEPTRLVNTVKGELDWIAMRCLEKDRTRRYQTATELAADVVRFLCHEPVTAVPPSQLYRFKKLTQKHRVQFAVAVGFFLLLLVFVAIQMKSHAKYKAIALSLRSELLDRAFNESLNGEIEPALKAIQIACEVGLSQQFAETLRGVAYYTAGEIETAVDQLAGLAAGPRNHLASSALVWAYCDLGKIAKAEELFEQLSKRHEESTGTAESDFGQVFLTRLGANAPGKADEDAVVTLSNVINRHRLWGFAYNARSEAYRDKFLRTKDIADLQAALNDDQMAKLLLPISDIVKNASLSLHLHACQYAQMFPDAVDETRRAEWHCVADELASHFSSRLSHWDGAAGALAYYRATDQVEVADALEGKFEKTFAHLQTVRDFRWFETRNYQSFANEMNAASAFTKHIYALALFEKGDREEALGLVESTVDRCKRNGDALASAIDILQLMQEFGRCEELAKQYLRSEHSWDFWEWPVLILKYYAGELPEQELLDLAYPFHTHVCYARYTLGVSHLARGDRESAKDHFRAAVDTGRIGWGAYGRAKVFLQRLEEAPNWLKD